jgi:hemolysin activation/secretion protein
MSLEMNTPMPNFYKLFCVVMPASIGLGAIGSGAIAQTPETHLEAPAQMAPASGATAQFAISGFDVTGDNPFSAEQSQHMLAPFVKTDATLETLQKATAAFEATLKEQGYPLHRVSLPPQDLGERVRLTIVKFVIGKVTVEGNHHFTPENVRASVPELLEGQAPNFSKLAVQTAISNESPSKQLQVSLKESDEADKIDVKLLVKDAKPWSLSTSLSNTGSDSTGQDRFALVANHANVFGLDHQFSGAYTTSLERSGDVKQIGLNYRMPLYARSAVLGLSYTKSDVLGSFGSFSSTGPGQTLGVTYSYYFAPQGGRRTTASLGLDVKQFNATQIVVNNMPPSFVNVDRESNPLTLNYTARVESDKASWGYNLDVVVNLMGGPGSGLIAYQTEDRRIERRDWRAVRGGGNYLTALNAGWLWGWRAQFQFSDDALISGEQFGIGGATSVRGTSERPVSGDSGAFTSLELSSPEWGAGWRGVGFVDAGWVATRNALLSSAGRIASDQLVSVGLGLRYSAGNYGLSVDWGRLLSGSSAQLTPTNPGLPQAGDQKIHLNLNARF